MLYSALYYSLIILLLSSNTISNYIVLGVKSNDADLSAELCHAVLDLAPMLFKRTKRPTTRTRDEDDAFTDGVQEAVLVGDNNIEEGDIERSKTVANKKEKKRKNKSERKNEPQGKILEEHLVNAEVDETLFVDEDGFLDVGRMKKVLRRPALVAPLPREKERLLAIDKHKETDTTNDTTTTTTTTDNKDNISCSNVEDTHNDDQTGDKSKPSSLLTSSSSSSESTHTTVEGEIVQGTLRGSLFMKVFQGQEYKGVYNRMKVCCIHLLFLFHLFPMCNYI